MNGRDEEIAALQSLERIGVKVTSMIRSNEATKHHRDMLYEAMRGLFNEYGELEYDIAALDKCRAALAEVEKTGAAQ